jgi:hypothetical protein
MKMIPRREPFTPIKVQSSYSGANGFYCSMYPTSDTLQRLVAHFQQVPQVRDRMVMPALQHVTLMYSEQPVPVPELPWIDRDLVIPATATGYDFFCKPHSAEGAVVMLLDSAGLTGYHEQLAEIAEYTWDEYKPHLTIAYGVKPTDAAIICAALSALPLPSGLQFTAPVFEDKS